MTPEDIVRARLGVRIGSENKAQQLDSSIGTATRFDAGEFWRQASAGQAYGVEGIGGPGGPPQTFFAELYFLLSELNGVIGEADNAASILRTRLLGPWPVAGDKAGSNEIAQPAMCEGALETVRSIIRRARELSDTAEILNARL